MLGKQFLDVGGSDVANRFVADVRIDLVLGCALISIIGRALHLREFINSQPVLHALFQRLF